MSSQPVCPDVRVSELADDAELSWLVDSFLGNLGPTVRNMIECLSSSQLHELARLAHQLKGAGGGYGFPAISEAARLIEEHVEAGHDLTQIQLAVGELSSLCQRAIAGGDRFGASVASTSISERA
jgi:HPt (histidine-containing phosphotransfer) domain-containing protein